MTNKTTLGRTLEILPAKVMSAFIAVFWSALTLAQAPPPAGFPGESAPQGPSVEILRFELDTTQVEPGDMATLSWEVINAYTISVEPDIGTVSTRGSLQVMPSESTVYTLTANGTGGAINQSATITVSGTAFRSPDIEEVAELSELPVPRLSNGKPDLTGVFISEGGLRSLVSSGQPEEVNLVAGAESYRVGSIRGIGAGEDCQPPGVPRIVSMPFPFQIVHKQDILVFAYEAYQQQRIVPMNTQHEDYLLPAWNGHSVGRWEGDTLVVDVKGFNDKSTVSGFRHTEAMTVTERYTRSSYDLIEYEAIIEDPNVFATPLRLEGLLRLHPEWQIQEYNCTENDQDYDALFD